MYCTSCGRAVTPGARFCAACGSRVDQSGDANSGETIIGDDPAFGSAATLPPASTPPADRRSTPTPRKPLTPRPGSRSDAPASSGSVLTASDAIGGGRFAPGVMIAERYRIVALLGRGGMGEVYRAEDLTLQQLIAIKFLPESLSRDAAALARFHSEVRIARQVSHGNVCRVFDIGDAEGIPFLTMEYVDGEDLASLLRRIGRLSPDKAVEIARQICAGLAAAHGREVIHRDLKPANVMLDGAGKVRITDFGLASIAAGIQGAEVRAGTPAYMAPEQLAGREVTAKSDLYSLGLVIYEILTGKRAFDAATLPELIKLRETGAPTNPSTLVRDLDPLLERIVLRCLEKDPAQRPASALQVAAALPGGDLLAAALAAGETPSPEMVAAAGSKEGIRRGLGLSLLGIVLIGLLVYPFAVGRYRLQNLTPMDRSPEVLTARAREIVRQLGGVDQTTEPDTAFGFTVDSDYLTYIQDHDHSASRWQRLAAEQPATLKFWYRQSPREMRSELFFADDAAGVVSPADPAFNVTGMAYLELDMQGRLLYLRRVPPQHDVRAASAPTPDWATLLAVASVNLSSYQPAKPEWTPLLFADERAAWTRPLPGPPGAVERVEAASFQGRPVAFELRYPWSAASRDQEAQTSTHQRYSLLVLLTLLAVALTASIAIVRRNRRLKHGDEAGSARLAGFVTLTVVLRWVFSAHHTASVGEFASFMQAWAFGFLLASLARMLYLALEPLVRRRDPHTMIGWSRLLAGKIRDPFVGRDILFGVAYGVLLSFFESSDNFLLPFFGKLPPIPSVPDLDSLAGVRLAFGAVLHAVWLYTLYSLLVFFLFFLLRLVLRKDWIAALAIVFLGAITNTQGQYFWATFVASVVIWLSIYLVLRRWGLLAATVGLVVQQVLVSFPVTSHLSAWYAPSALVGMAAVAALALFAFRSSLGDQALFADSLLER